MADRPKEESRPPRPPDEQSERQQKDSAEQGRKLPDVPLWDDQGIGGAAPDVKTWGEDAVSDLPPPVWESGQPPAPGRSSPLPPPIEIPAVLQQKLERPEPPAPDSASVEAPLFQPLMRRHPPAPELGPGGARMGILGGKASGKSYLLQSLIYRTQSAAHSGALSLYLKGGKVQAYRAEGGRPQLELISTQKLIRAYRSWARLSFTQLDHQAWYRLALTFRSGLLGRSCSTLHVDFMDTSGEYREMSLSDESHDEWREAYLNVRLMAFCIPLWAAFPADWLSAEDRQRRERHLQGFDSVVRNYRALLDAERRRPKVRSLLVLTMADDRRGDLVELTDSWITPYLDEPQAYLRRLQKESGLARYLANARKVSRLLRQAFASAEPSVARIPEILDFGQGRPWIVPVSAVEGAALDAAERSGALPPAEPVPAHVELPLLLALCETHNVLM